MSGGDPWPKHHQLYLVLRQQIREGAFDGGVPLPSEHKLGGEFGVSRITVRRAMERLEQEGFVERHRGRGTFVRDGAAISPVQASISGSVENLVAMGLETQVRVMGVDYVPPPPAVARQLGLAAGAPCQRAVRVRALDGRPFSHLTTYVPEEIGRTFDVDDLARTPLLILIAQAGRPIARAAQSVSATLATPEIARALDIDPGEALLAIRRVVRDVDGRAVEVMHGLYRPDTYEHEMALERTNEGGVELWKAR
ncbi:GntR family transcriptional regulator [Salinarimonas ramus]|uniref:GntR family transcriptional regulator n=1 Tax=Salinarimonas ramus TaxID=690164 RepID=UPI001AEEE7EA|nr:GntR family transcriptional regulator [Salinarimonas ramus]